jgi:hypothetical protein
MTVCSTAVALTLKEPLYEAISSDARCPSVLCLKSLQAHRNASQSSGSWTVLCLKSLQARRNASCEMLYDARCPYDTACTCSFGSCARRSMIRRILCIAFAVACAGTWTYRGTLHIRSSGVRACRFQHPCRVHTAFCVSDAYRCQSLGILGSRCVCSRAGTCSVACSQAWLTREAYFYVGVSFILSSLYFTQLFRERCQLPKTAN